MVNKVKRVLKNTAVFAAVMLLISGGGVLSVKAARGVSYDFSFSLQSQGDRDWTSTEAKDTTDWCSMQCTWSEFPGASYYAYACDNLERYASEKMVYFEQGTWALIGNSIKENGSDLCRIVAIGDYIPSDGCVFTGYWYADSGF